MTRRKTKKLPKKQRYYDTLRSAASALKISLAALKIAKRSGAPGFRSGRVYPADLLPWLRANKPADGGAVTKEILEMRKLLGQCERIEFDNRVARGDYELKSDVERWVTELVTAAKTVLLGLPGQLAPQVVGLSVADAELCIRAGIDDAIAQLHRGDPPSTE